MKNLDFHPPKNYSSKNQRTYLKCSLRFIRDTEYTRMTLKTPSVNKSEYT